MPSTDTILIDFVADTKSLDQTIALLEKLGQIDKKTADSFRASTEAYKQREQTVNLTSEATKKLGDTTEQSSKKSKESISGVEQEAGRLESRMRLVAERIVAAFAIGSVIKFGEEVTKAFAAAELATSRLTFAVTKIIGGTPEQVKQLVEQSERLSKTTFFSPRQIQEAQSLAVQFGLTAKQTEELTNIIPDLAVALNTDLKGATDVALRAIEGQSRGLKVIGADFKDTGSKVDNFNTLIANVSKLQGTAADALNTTSGKIKEQEKEFEILQEKIGKDVAPAFVEFKKGLLVASDAMLLASQSSSNLAVSLGILLGQASGGFIGNFKKQVEDLKKASESKPTEELQKEFIELGKRQEKLSGDARTYALAQREAILQVLADRKKVGAEEKAVIEDITHLTKLQLQQEIDSYKKRSDAATIFVKDEIERREKQIEEIDKAQKKADDESKKKREEALQSLKELEAKINQDSLKELQQTEEQKLQIEEDFAIKELDDKAKAAGVDIQNDKAYLAAKSQLQDEYFQKIFNAFETENEKEKELKKKPIELHPDRKDFDAIEKEQIAYNKRSEELAKELAKKKIEIERQLAQTIIEGLFDISKAQSEIDIQTINVQRDAQNKAIDEQLAKIEDQHNKHHLSDKKFAQQQKALQAEKEKNDQAALKKENEIKRSQDIADRERKLFEIAIATYKGVAEATASLQPQLIPLIIAIGAAESALVLATPLPKYHTGKLAKTNSNEIHAIVRDDETIFDPQQSREYEPTFKAIYNKKVSPKLINDFVNFSLKKEVSDSFAQNIYNSTQINYDLLASKVGSEIAWKLRGDKTMNIANDSINKLAKALEQTHDPRRN